VTASELLDVYADAALTRSFSQADLLALARAVQKEITFQKLDGYALSSADVFALLSGAMTEYADRQSLPAAVTLAPLDGPARSYLPPTGGIRSSSFRWSAFARAVHDVSDYCRTFHRLPDEVWVGSESLSPADYLATLGRAFEELARESKPPAEVTRTDGHFTPDKFVAEDSTQLWSWPIFPEGFHAPRIMELARLQAWTLKPAVMRRSQ
jgi:hypothetical protein